MLYEDQLKHTLALTNIGLSSREETLRDRKTWSGAAHYGIVDFEEKRRENEKARKQRRKRQEHCQQFFHHRLRLNSHLMHKHPPQR